MMTTIITPHSMAGAITKAASKQTYYTIRFLADRDRVADAYRAYAYFRWLDDTLDSGHLALTSYPLGSGAVGADDTCPPAPLRFGDNNGGRHLCWRTASLPKACQGARERVNFLERQKSLLERCYRGESIRDAILEENMLIELVQHDHEKNSGLQFYLRNMMHVMEFDAKRRGRLISQAELDQYTYWLASAVTEAMHYFIGHDGYSPHDATRYLAVTGAHITHMLRDTFDDIQAGYYNIPREVLEAAHLGPDDAHTQAYRAWVRSRVQLARECFKAGRDYLSRVENPRCRLAGFAYTARFEYLLDTMERQGYYLRPEYSERKSFGTGLQMAVLTLSSLLHGQGTETLSRPVVSQPLREL